VSGCRSEAGRLFQILGPATEKLLSPLFRWDGKWLFDFAANLFRKLCTVPNFIGITQALWKILQKKTFRSLFSRHSLCTFHQTDYHYYIWLQQGNGSPRVRAEISPSDRGVCSEIGRALRLSSVLFCSTQHGRRYVVHTLGDIVGDDK